jgi:hypothetical protein
MNARRVAELEEAERHVAELRAELDVALADEPAANDPPRARRNRVIVPTDLPEPAELDRARARKTLARLGLGVKR